MKCRFCGVEEHEHGIEGCREEEIRAEFVRLFYDEDYANISPETYLDLLMDPMNKDTIGNAVEELKKFQEESLK